MALRNILSDNEPTLLKKSRPVTEYNDRIHTLLDDMKETMLHAEGVGLAAPQVGVLRRVIVVLDTMKEDGEPEDHIYELINPEIISEDGEQEGLEGCLSVPGKVGIVKRPMRVKVQALDRHGKKFEIEGEAMTARTLCHEIDHLNGILYTSLASEIFDSDSMDEYFDKDGTD